MNKLLVRLEVILKDREDGKHTMIKIEDLKGLIKYLIILESIYDEFE